VSGGARISSGIESKQDYATPTEFLDAVETRWGKLHLDLAAHSQNVKLPRWYGPGGEKENTLAIDLDWPLDLRCWLNPEFNNIEPYVAKCCLTQRRRRLARFDVNGMDASETLGAIFLLVPASIGSNWFRDYVNGVAAIYALNPRIQFDGSEDPFMRDCILAVYGHLPGFDVWRWK
jgi:DNA N-6-adenine-methyltransferase (Dam)